MRIFGLQDPKSDFVCHLQLSHCLELKRGEDRTVSERDQLPAKLPRVINTTTSTQKAMPFDRRTILLTLRSLVMGVSTKTCEMRCLK